MSLNLQTLTQALAKTAAVIEKRVQTTVQEVTGPRPLQDYDLLDQSGSAGPGLIWKIYPARPRASAPSTQYPLVSVWVLDKRALSELRVNQKNPRRVAPLPVSKVESSSTSDSAVNRISDKLRQLGSVQPQTRESHSHSHSHSHSPGEIFIPTPHHVPPFRLASTLHPPHNDMPLPPSLAELTLPPHHLRRLRSLGIKLPHTLKLGKAGVTEGVVNGIHERWTRSELVKLKCRDHCRQNMKRTHQILETKTGGLVVWRSGTIIVLYRGPNYKYPYFNPNQPPQPPQPPQPQPWISNATHNTLPLPKPKPSFVPGVGTHNKVRLQLPGEAKLAQEAHRLLDGLGPRFLDWSGLDPKPVDADLLPGLIMGFRKPFRILPFGIKQSLTDSELTTLRRLGQPLPCHFALGRNRNLQGLAQAMIKLWEKCEIAKIAVKRGVQNTNTEIMAEELKKLTGGTLLSRDREYIVFYRGKDFLPLAVSAAIEERRKCGNNTAKVQEESHEGKTISDSKSVDTEPMPIEKHGKERDSAINKLEAKLSLAITKKEKAEKLLEELENNSESPTVEQDNEPISEEERYMLRKVGLRMKPFLLMGRRGIFDGTVENMHLHWKYRELVKIISKDKDIEEVERAARILESESGGILVAVERVSKGHAIIIYRGKNYRRPKTLRPKSLLSKREAMKRSLEAQRRQSLKLHVLSLSRNIEELKQLMNKDEPLPAHSILKSTNYMDNSGVPTSSGINGLDASQDNSEDVVGTAYEAPSLGTGEEVLIVGSKSGTEIQPTYIQPVVEVCSPSGASSPEEENLDKAGTDEIPFKAAPLSNKERLILRKQALKMKKRPVLAVGRNNVIAGVAKTIKTHFQKHPLAIVNIKNRAEGTSVSQLIFELEEATSAVLVSREPNKVILYRGWQEGEKPGDAKKMSNATTSSKENGDPISPELMAAIRVECGFHPSNEEE